MALNNMPEALQDLNEVIKIANSDKVAHNDRECLNTLKLASGNQGNNLPHDKQTYLKAIAPLNKLIEGDADE